MTGALRGRLGLPSSDSARPAGREHGHTPDLQATAPAPPRHGRIDDIEVLRAVAVIFVMIHHAHGSLITWPVRGFDWFSTHFILGSGVNIFFGVSGFVIARSILRTLAETRSHRAYANMTLGFWTRRAWRLLPSAWLWLVLVQVAAVTFNASNAFMSPHANDGAWEAGILNVANFRFAERFGSQEYGASFPYWSLSLEEQFYFLFPILIFIFRNYLKYVAAVLIAIQWMLPPLFYPLLMHSIRTDGLLFGVLVAIWVDHRSYSAADKILSRMKAVMPFIVLALLAGLGAVAAGDFEISILYPAPVTIFCTLLVVIASFNRGYVLPGGAVKRVILWAGSRSYALYLIHIPAFCAAREIWFRIMPAGTVFAGTYTLRYVLTAVLLVVVLSELNYRLVEHPLRSYGVKVADRIQRHGIALPKVRAPLLASAAVWLAMLGMAEAGRIGLLGRIFAAPIAPGTDLAETATFARLAGDGWSAHEPWGIWSIGDRAGINVPIARNAAGQWTLAVDGSVLLGEKHPQATVAFRANGIEIGRYTAVTGKDRIDERMAIPAGAFAADPGYLRIDILVDRPISPYALGISLDRRSLGFALRSMKLLKE